jgi:hypothetical protein
MYGVYQLGKENNGKGIWLPFQGFKWANYHETTITTAAKGSLSGH